jgi:hypothetical protein
MKGYWIDKKDHPWHRLYKILEREWKKTEDPLSISKKLMLLRDGVFGALGILSFSLPLDISTAQVLHTLTRAKSWREGRQRVRSKCVKLATEMISSGDVAHLVPSGLQRDGFGFIVDELSEALLEEFRKAEPRVRKGQANLGRLSGSVLGRHVLRKHMITETKMPEDDPRFQKLLQEYQRLLVEMELNDELVPLEETFQITLNGRIAEEVTEGRDYREEKVDAKDVQSSLTDFLEMENQKKKPESKKNKKKPKSKKRKKKPGRKKRSSKGGKS